MSIIFRKNTRTQPQQETTTVKTRASGHTRPRKPEIDLEQIGRLRVANLMAILNVSHTTLYAGIKTGRYPSPDGRDGKFPFWMTSTIREFLGR